MSYTLINRIRGLYRTAFEKITVAIVVLLVITVILLIVRTIPWGIIGIGGIILLGVLWGQLLQEECIISSLKDHGGSGNYQDVSKEFSQRALFRLQKKNIVEIQQATVNLVNPQQPCAFDKFRRKSR